MPVIPARDRNLPYELGLAIWHKALECEIGIGFAIQPPDARQIAINRFYEIRQQANDPELDRIAIMAPNNGELWFCKKAVEL